MLEKIDKLELNKRKNEDRLKKGGKFRMNLSNLEEHSMEKEHVDKEVEITITDVWENPTTDGSPGAKIIAYQFKK